MIKSLYLLLPFLLLVASALSSCDSASHRYRIGVSQCSQDDWRMKVNDEIQREMIFHDNATVEIRSAQDNNAKQIADIEYFIDNGFDAIIVAPNEAEAITPVIEKAYRKGIPVVVFDRDINSDAFTAKVQVDNESIGREAARYARRQVDGQLNVIEFQGLKGSSPAAARHKGFAAEIAGQPDSRVLASVYADWYEVDAERAADSLIALYPEVNVFYAHNDRMAIGAARAARRQKRRDIKIIGIDAAPNLGIKAVADSVIDATFFYPTEGHLIVQTVMKILQGEPYDNKIMIPALPAVDLSNAAILLSQDAILQAETEKLLQMNTKANTYSSKYNAQTAILIVSILLIVSLFAFLFVLFRSSRILKANRKELAKRNEELQAQRDKLQDLYRRLDEAMQSKLVFFTNVSHDLRTPLTLISEPVKALARSQHIDDNEREMLRIADRNIGILHRLINQILDFRKFESGKLDFHPRQVHPEELIRQWLESFDSAAQSRKIHLEFKSEMSPAISSIALDEEKIERVVYNLVSNALRHTDDGGTITVDLKVDERCMTLRVRDNGEGIAPDKLPHIFEQFYQASDHGSGSGIGLSLAKAFVEVHEGTIEVASTLGKGTEFTVRIPVIHIESVQAKDDTQKETSAESAGMTGEPDSESDKPILLAIDDNYDILTLLSRLMGDSYNVITAADGKDGVDKALRYVPDIILCDVMMPGMDGLECCRRIKENMATSHIPVLMLTARSLDEQRVEGYESGADAYIAKPFNSDVLRARVRNLLDNRKRIKNVYGAVETDNVKDRAKLPVEVAGGVRTDIDDDFYRKFMNTVAPRLSDSSMSVESIAEQIGLSQSQLNRKIKALTGLTPVELIRKLRLGMARRMLQQTELPVSEVASACGFTSHAYFSKCYRDAYGQSPTELRGH